MSDAMLPDDEWRAIARAARLGDGATASLRARFESFRVTIAPLRDAAMGEEPLFAAELGSDR